MMGSRPEWRNTPGVAAGAPGAPVSWGTRASSVATITTRGSRRGCVNAHLSEINRVIIPSQAAGHDRVTFIHTEGNRDNVHFHNRPQARMVWFEDTGGRAEGWFGIMFMPGVQAGATRGD